MSYDLMFSTSPGQELETPALSSYFQGKRNYKVEKSQAWYENEDTGVYFGFDLGPEQPDEDEEDPFPSVASFNLNYFRPHIFGLEAEPEVAAFIETFKLGVHDPQVAGMEDDPYSREGFLRGWNKGNEVAYSAIIGQNGLTSVRHSLPGTVIERCWRWNYGRNSLQSLLGDSIFVPKILFMLYKQRLCTALVWPDAIPVALPPADLYLVCRQAYAPRRLFAPKKEDVVVVESGTVEPLISPYRLGEGELPYRLLDYRTPPGELTAWIRCLTAGEAKPEIVAVDSILNSEIVATCSES